MIDRSDEETGELVREWLQRYGLSILAGIIIAIALLSSYEWWKNHQKTTRSAITSTVLALHEAVSQHRGDKAQALYKKISASDKSLEPLAALLMATLAHDTHEQKQEQQYLDIARGSKDPLIQQTANWQLAQLQVAHGDAAAQQALQALKGSAYDNQLALMRAVLAQKQGKKQQALDAYQQALQDNPAGSAFINAQIAALKGELLVSAPQEK